MSIDDIKLLIKEGENSQVEFKSQDVPNEELAITIIAFLNGLGGLILLGVEDDGSITGIEGSVDTKMNAINQICQNRIKPAIIPMLDAYTIEGHPIMTITVEKGVQKPYYLIKNEKTLFYIRVGTTSRLASPEQIAVLYSVHPMVHYDASPIPDMAMGYLDERRIHQYFTEIKKLTEKAYQDRREQLYLTSRIAVKLPDRIVATVAGGLLFAQRPSQFIVSAGIRCAVFEGTTKLKDETSICRVDFPIQLNQCQPHNNIQKSRTN